MTKQEQLKLVHEGNRKHGHCAWKDGKKNTTTEYRIWRLMIRRCDSPKDKNYKYYGGRGITVCERWRKFENFLADMGRRPAGLTLDRIDRDMGYSPDNCRWATWKQQNDPEHRPPYPCRLFECGGESLTIRQWAGRLGVNINTLKSAVHHRKETIEQFIRRNQCR